MVVIEKVDCKSFFAAVLHRSVCAKSTIKHVLHFIWQRPTKYLFGRVQPNIYLAASDQIFIWQRPSKY